MFFNDYYNSLPFLTIDINTLDIIKKSDKFYSNLNFNIKNNLFYNIEDKSLQKQLSNRNQDLSIINIKNQYFKLIPIYNIKNIDLLFIDITHLYIENIMNIDQINIINNKYNNIKNILKNTNDIYNEMNFIYIIFNENKTIYQNDFFINNFDNKNIKDILKEDYNKIIYKLNFSKQIYNKIINWKDEKYHIYISKYDNNYFLLGYNITNDINNKEELKDNYETIINIIGYIVHKKSRFTQKHINNVRILTKKLAKLYQKEYGLFLEEDIDLLSLASSVHDIGKLEIPTYILEKKGKLTIKEMEIMKTHTIKGKELIEKYTLNLKKPSKLLNICSIVAFEHHEKWNGKGYPNKKKGTNIHLYSRIVSLVDVLEALMVKRPYKKAWTKENILDFLKKEKNVSFDPKLTDLIINNYDDFFNSLIKI